MLTIMITKPLPVKEIETMTRKRETYEIVRQYKNAQARQSLRIEKQIELLQEWEV